MKLNNKKILSIIAILITVICVLLLLVFMLVKDKDSKTENSIQNPSQSQTESALKVEEIDENPLQDIKNDPAYKNPKRISYAELFRNSEKYEGDYIGFTGEVIQVLGEPGSWNLRVNVTKQGDEGFYYYDDTVLIESTSQERVIERDIIKFTGLYLGPETYESVLGGDITVPYLVIYEHKVVGRSE